MFAGALLRSLLVYQGSASLGRILLLLLVWLLLFLGGAILFPRFPKLSSFVILLETGLVVLLLLLIQADYFAILFAILGMQVMQHFPARLGAAFIGLSAVLTFLALLQPYGALQAVALAVAFSAVSVFAGAFIQASRRARALQEKNRILVGELQEANRQLEASTRRMQELAAARERQHLARELHDSITQTIFSMNLTTQSTRLLLEREPPKVAAQLERLTQLTHSALAEMQVLISRLAPEQASSGGLLATLQQHLAGRQELENLSVSLEVEGSEALSPAEEQGLFRIAQEALNNIVKHAGVTRASLRLHLGIPPWLEIADQGAGFDPGQARDGGHVGLAGMRERAAGIGWSLQVESTPGRGTRIRVTKDPEGAKQT